MNRRNDNIMLFASVYAKLDNDECVANIELALSLRKFTRSLTQTRDLSPTLRVGDKFIFSHLSTNQITVFEVVA